MLAFTAEALGLERGTALQGYGATRPFGCDLYRKYYHWPNIVRVERETAQCGGSIVLCVLYYSNAAKDRWPSGALVDEASCC